MHFKTEIVVMVYNYYVKGVPLNIITHHCNLNDSDVEEIIDYVNLIIL